MTVRDDTADLLARARAALKAETLPHLPPDRRYPTLMVLTALGIAGRRAITGAAWRAEALATLKPFAPHATDVATAEAHLAAALRSSPETATPALHAALLSVARAACAESNPKARALKGLPNEAWPDSCY